ncbi:unnamed protein product [Didymodactylos carnosus]|uniref:Phosphodiester glycosidase domain-containing protein n=1 Tax=Didymodactylos carnosus TaxID=1234261 RepID=A0A815W4M6_9BILA|nr:unnamed protein product [Didymodactylos carnosus]CAF1540588.1 unnamed protein product [Didymodactylos carnosus]CAF3875678.1 unnamed protein product [Didymodactylos carnosus]CAF4400881.1 unnamed protein product [Didymodactylos carnosus]
MTPKALHQILSFDIGITAGLKKAEGFLEVPVAKLDSTRLIKLPSYWLKDVDLMTNFPDGIEIYRTTSYYKKSMNAYCVVFDPKANIEMKPVMSSINKKPSELYAKEKGVKYGCINGGYFGTQVSYSLVLCNGIMDAINIKSLSRRYNNVSTTYYPTRGAFGVTTTDVPEVTWVYHVGSGNGTLFSYLQPSLNNVRKPPQSMPTAKFPANASIWNINSAIGGSPVLIKNNKISITDTEELIEIDNMYSRARSAIGHTADGKIIVLAVEGSGGIGVSLPQMAQLMKDMGCTAALNLDGGGSTAFIINGKQIVKPSDPSGERAVISAIIIKGK